MQDFLSQIPFWAVLSLMPVLVIIELFITTSKLNAATKKRAITLTCYILGVFIPAMWLYWVAETRTETVLLILMIGYFGFYKVSKLDKVGEADQ
ncbi:MAG: hypothetical protein MI867_26965 [Pseudomonadales bacterium]|nr:hypothetical protein [Pseudomonadales bacterium]